MNLALTLLVSAFQLLTMVTGNPNLPQSFKDNAILIANQAIEVANEELKNPAPVAPQVIYVQPQNIGAPVEVPVVKEIVKDISYEFVPYDRNISQDATPKIGKPFSVLVKYTEDGITSPRVYTYTFNGQSKIDDRTAHKCVSLKGDGCSSSFSFTPTATTTMVTVTVDGFSKDIEVKP